MAVVPTGSSFPASLEIELGTPGMIPNSVTGVGFIDQWEDVPELRWPAAARVYGRMAKDAKVRGAQRAVISPILRKARFRVSPVGADPRVVSFVQGELGLTGEDERATARRRREGIVFGPYARESMHTKATYGHAVFEQVYRIGGPSADQAAAGLTGVFAHLRKLAPRPPRTLGEPVVEVDGGLSGWRQLVNKPTAAWQEIVLPIDRLVVHVLEKEGADWRGQSLLRSAWKHWAIRDVLMRVGAMAVERNGMGIPVVSFDPDIVGVTRERALQLAKAIRAGDEAAVALPAGYELSLMGVAGQTIDSAPLLKYHGEMIGQSFTAMVLDLGHDSGARSLGDTFLDLLCQGQNALADDWCDEVTEYVIRDLVELNFGPDEPVPALIKDDIEPANITWADVAEFAKQGLIIPDDNTEAEIRRIRGLPMWPGMPTGEPGFGLGEIIDVDPNRPMPAPPAPNPLALPAPTTDQNLPVAASLGELEQRLATVQAGLEARRAERPGRR